MPDQLLGIYREEVFSPGKVAEDAAILDCAVAELCCPGYSMLPTVPAERLDPSLRPPSRVLSMAQSPAALAVLEQWQTAGVQVINTPQAVRQSLRRPQLELLAAAALPLPPGRVVAPAGVEAAAVALGSAGGVWLKRGDVHAVEAGDVVRVTTPAQLRRALGHFRRRRIPEILVQAHLEGETIKFYGVGPGDFFRAFDAAGRELAGVSQLARLAQQAAAAVGLEVYGGDAVRTPAGALVLIDLNDWPSFSRCRREAAQGIARYIRRVYGGFHGFSTELSDTL